MNPPVPAPATVAAGPPGDFAARFAPPPPNLMPLKALMWLSLALWVFEGALRKWIFPGLASPLLIVRDPILLLMYALALAKGIFPRSAFIFWIGGLGLIALILSMAGTEAPLFVELYGFRADYLHLPLIFLLPAVFNRDDVRAVGKWALIVALPMSVLVMLQFGAKGNSRLNVGVGGEGTMLDAAFGRIRPSGTFSFTNGLSDFTATVTAFFLYHLLEKRVYPRLLWLAAVPALVILILLSASRGLVGLLIVVLVMTMIISILQPRYLASTLKVAGLGVAASMVVGSFAIFRVGLNVFMYRFGSADNVRVGFVDRFFGGLLAPFDMVNSVDAFGVGLGMGTNVGTGLRREGERGFLYGEGELSRVMLESGPVIGMAFIALRVAMVAFLFSRALRSLRKESHPLPLLLFGACGVEMITGQFGQATTLGFVTLACGLCLAANEPGKPKVEESAEAAAATNEPSPSPNPRRLSAPPRPEAPARPVAPAAPPPTVGVRGRSLYAEELHRQAEEEARRRQAADGGEEAKLNPSAADASDR